MHPDFAHIGDPTTNLIEECAELIQALTKLQRFGPGVPPYDNRARVIDEIADVRNRITEWDISLRSGAKGHAMTPTQSPTLASQATAELPKLPEPYSAKSTIKCTACGAPYAPPMTLAGGAAQWPGGLLPPHACRCGNTQFGGMVSSESLSPAQFTADHMNAYYLAGYEAGRASRAQSEWQPIGWQFRFVFPTHASNWKSVLSLPLNEKMAGPIPGIEAKYETRLVYAATLGETK